MPDWKHESVYGDSVFLAHVDLEGRFDESFPSCLFSPEVDLSTVAQQNEMTVCKCSLMSCMWDYFPHRFHSVPGQHSQPSPASLVKNTRKFICQWHINICIGICLGDVTFTHKQCTTNTSLVIHSSDLNFEHVVQWTQALTYPSAPTHSWHTDKHTQFCTDAPNLHSKHIRR